MEDVLDLYAEPPDPKRPVVCFDESPTQLIGEVRQPIPAAPGQLERYDCEYRRNGTVNLFVFLDAHRPWRKVKVTDQRTARDFAECMRESGRRPLSRRPSRSASCWTICRPIRRARSTRPSRHRRRTASCAAWSSTTPPSTPAGSTWSRSRSACCAASASTAASATRRRLVAEIAAWERQRNAAGARIKWMFTTERARTKLARAYPDPAKES